MRCSAFVVACTLMPAVVLGSPLEILKGAINGVSTSVKHAVSNVADFIFDDIITKPILNSKLECFNDACSDADYYKIKNKLLFEISGECYKCIHQINPSGFSPTYFHGLFNTYLKTPYIGNIAGACQSTPLYRELNPTESGVNITEHPSGWIKQENGAFTGCERTHHRLGYGWIFHNSYDEATRLSKELPKKLEVGNAVRQNWLGPNQLDEYPFRHVVPKTIGLGALPNQHRFVRPILRELYGHCDDACYTELLHDIKARFDKAGNKLDYWQLATEFTFDVLWERTFPGHERTINDEQFSKAQLDMIVLGYPVQMLPRALAEIVNHLRKTSQDRVHDSFLEIVKKLHGDRIEGEGPSLMCYPADPAEILTNAFSDVFLAAGGIGTPTSLRQAMWMLYSKTHDHMDEYFPKNYTYDKSNIMPFFYEVIRLTPPVAETQYFDLEGNHHLINIAMQNMDPNLWGEDSMYFKVRDLEFYKEHFGGFAEFVNDNTVQPFEGPNNITEGAQDRFCPGKELATSIVKAWFAAFEQDDWYNCAEEGHTGFNIPLCRKVPTESSSSFLSKILG